MSHRRRLLILLMVCALAAGIVAATTDADPRPVELHFVPRSFGPSPGPPPPPDAEVELRLDDGGAEGIYGFTDTDARQFLWFNRFDSPDAFSLDEVWVLFPPDPTISVGGAIELVIYSDDDADPSNGAELIATFDFTVQAADGVTFSRYPLAAPLVLPDDDDVLIGAINRYYQTGIDPPSTFPASVDTTDGQARSWVAVWTDDPPASPELPADAAMTLLDGAIGGNWLIRGFGTPTLDPVPPVVEVPTVSDLGLMILMFLMITVALPRLGETR